MKNFYIYFTALMLFMLPSEVMSQYCNNGVPTFYVNLTGQPSGVYFSPSTIRNEFCCGAVSPDKCIAFVVTLDSSANGIKFDIVSGAVPPGALYYQVACGPPVPVGEPLCLNGPGPHYLTFCKPGNNQNVYAITSLPQPTTYGTEWVSQTCSGQFGVSGLIDTSITWTSLPPNPVYNSYLSCQNGCTDVTITPPATGVPPTIDYQVCGYVIGGCFPYFFCDTFTVNFVNNLDVNITPQNHVICYGAPDIPITANITGGMAPYQFLWNTGQTTQSITVGAGVYSVQILDSMNCSIAFDTVTVIGVPSQIVSDAGSDQLLCMGPTSVQLGGSIQTATGGIWSGGSGAFSPGNTTLNATYTPSLSEINAGMAQLILTTTGNQGCPAESDTVSIIISPNPAPSVSGNNNVCEFSTQTYIAPLEAGISYQWNVVGGTVISATNNVVSILWGVAGTGTIILTETNTLTCDSTITYNVNINPLPTPVITGSSDVCTGTTISYAVANPVAGDNYLWTVTGGTIIGTATGNSVQIQWTSAGQATVSLNQSNSYGCDSTVSTSVNVHTMPMPSIIGNASGCAGQSITYTTPLVQGNSYLWNVNGGTITSNTNNAITVFWPIATNGTVTLTEANTLSCDSTITLNVVIGPQPAPLINGQVVVCATDQNVYTITNPNPGNLLIWTVSGGTIIGPTNGTSVLVEWNNIGNQTLTLTESNSYNCSATVSIIVNVRPKPAPDLNGPNNSCEALHATYSVQNIPGYTYQWSVTGGSIVGTAVNNSIDVLWTTPGFGLVKVRVLSPQGCDSTVSMPVTVFPAPRPAIVGPGIVCSGESVSLNTIFSSGNTYSWTASNAVIVGNASGNLVQVNLNNPGTATLTVTETTNNGCVQQASFQIQVNEKPAPNIAGSNIGCISNQPYQYSTPLQPFVTYQWNVTGGQITAGSGTSSISVQWTNSGQQLITLVATNILSGCDSTVTLNVLTGDLPVPVINAASLTGCSPVTISFNGNVVNPQYQYFWDFGDGSFGVNPNPTHIFNSPGLYNVTLNASNNTGCFYSTSAVIESYPSPVSQFSMVFGSDLYYAEISTLTLNNLSSGANQYLWEFGNGDTSSLFEPNYNYNLAGNYTITLIVTNQYGCSDFSSQVIEVIAPGHLYVPNAFSPNNDNINDYFSSGNWNIEDLTIAIYNRWGDAIYTAGGSNFRWDGTYKGKPVPEGVYVYKIAARGIRGEEFNKMGTVTLIR